MSAITDAVDKMGTEVTGISDVVDSAVTLLGSLAQQIRDNANVPTNLNALADALDAKAKTLGEAIAANTV